MGTEASVRRDRLVARMTAMAGRRFSTLGGSTARSRARRGRAEHVRQRAERPDDQARPQGEQRSPARAQAHAQEHQPRHQGAPAQASHGR